MDFLGFRLDFLPRFSSHTFFSTTVFFTRSLMRNLAQRLCSHPSHLFSSVSAVGQCRLGANKTPASFVGEAGECVAYALGLIVEEDIDDSYNVLHIDLVVFVVDICVGETE